VRGGRVGFSRKFAEFFSRSSPSFPALLPPEYRGRRELELTLHKTRMNHLFTTVSSGHPQPLCPNTDSFSLASVQGEGSQNAVSRRLCPFVKVTLHGLPLLADQRPVRDNTKLLARTVTLNHPDAPCSNDSLLAVFVAHFPVTEMLRRPRRLAPHAVVFNRPSDDENC